MEVRMNQNRYSHDNIKSLKEKYNDSTLMELMEDLTVLYWDFEITNSHGQVTTPSLNEDMEVMLFKMKRYNALVKSGLRNFTNRGIQCMIDEYKELKLL